jgi:hypothetical protein
MATNSILTYLPDGWTEERYKNATDDDWETLSEEVILARYLISGYINLLTKKTGSRTSFQKRKCGERGIPRSNR